MKYQFLLFDLDNTLLDFNASEAYALRKIFEDRGIEFTNHINETYHRINKWCWTKFEENKINLKQLKPLRMELTLKELELDFDPNDFSKSYHDKLAETDFWVEGASQLIQDLAPHYELVIITNGIERIQKARLQNTGLTPYFSTIVISETIGVSKPNKAYFDYTFEQINHPPKEQCLVIGDSLSSDIKGGNEFGLDTCWHNFKNLENDRDIQPTYEINRIQDLKKILDN